MSAKKRMGSGKRNYDSLVFWMVILVILIILWSISTSSGDKIEKIEFSGFLQQAKSGNISSVEIEGQNLTFSVKTDTLVINGKTLDTKATKFKTVLPDGYAADLVKGLSESYPDLKIEVNLPKGLAQPPDHLVAPGAHLRLLDLHHPPNAGGGW